MASPRENAYLLRLVLSACHVPEFMHPIYEMCILSCLIALYKACIRRLNFIIVIRETVALYLST